MTEVIFLIILSFFMIAAGIGLIYAIGICTRCEHWSMYYECPNCKRGRYDYTE